MALSQTVASNIDSKHKTLQAQSYLLELSMNQGIAVEADHEDHDDHHVPLWILSLIGIFVAILVLLPNIWFANRRPVKED